MLPKSKNNHHAFTLIELLVVMAIIAVLSGLGLMGFGTIQVKSRDSRRKQDLASISKALDTYYNDYGVYPGDTNGYIWGCGLDGIHICNWGDPWQDGNGTLYMNSLPQDPASNQHYLYDRVSDHSYYLFARLENELDGDAAVNAAGDPSFYTGYVCDATSLGCNYVIMSTNLTKKPAVN